MLGVLSKNWGWEVALWVPNTPFPNSIPYSPFESFNTPVLAPITFYRVPLPPLDISNSQTPQYNLLILLHSSYSLLLLWSSQLLHFIHTTPLPPLDPSDSTNSSIPFSLITPLPLLDPTNSPNSIISFPDSSRSLPSTPHSIKSGTSHWGLARGSDTITWRGLFQIVDAEPGGIFSH